MHIHVFPVDLSMTPDDAWKELCIFGQRITYTFGQRITYTGTEGWSAITCADEECANIQAADCA